MNNKGDQVSLRLWDELTKGPYRDQAEKIMLHGSGDIGPEFLGFMETYYHLSLIISPKRTIIDLGCAYGFQAYYFKDHLGYVGVDNGDGPQLVTPNAKYYKMNIEDFIKMDLTEHSNPFAICNYVPMRSNKEVRERFSDLFVFYVSHDDVKHMHLMICEDRRKVGS